MTRNALFLALGLFFCSCSFDAEEQELCFIGDSITYLWDVEYYFPNYVITKHAVSGAGLAHVNKWNVEDCSKKTTVLLIGTNDIGYWKSTEKNIEYFRSEFTSEFLKTAQRIDAEPLIVISILPRNEWGKQDTLVTANIKEQNRELRQMLSREMPNSLFIDVYDQFIYKGNQIREDLFKDGLHPNEAGYEILAREVQKKL